MGVKTGHTKYTKETQEKVIALSKTGLSMRQIVSQTGIPISSVYRMIKQTYGISSPITEANAKAFVHKNGYTS